MSSMFDSSVGNSMDGSMWAKDFRFQRRHGRLDWRKLSSVDIDRVMRDVDLDALEDNLENIKFAEISEDDLRYFTDSNFLKLFRMAPFTVEYLIHVQNFLHGQNSTLEKQVADSHKQLEGFYKQLGLQAEEAHQLRKEMRRQASITSLTKPGQLF